MASQESALSRITAEITCPCCSSVFENPRTLPCGHVYCLACLEGLSTKPTRASNSDATGGAVHVECAESLSCPECCSHADIPPGGVRNFPDAFGVNSLLKTREDLLLESKKAEGPPTYCGECKGRAAIGFCSENHRFLCERCSKATHASSHRILPLYDDGQGSSSEKIAVFCPAHPSHLLTSYCERCDKMLCRTCLEGHNRSHTPRPILEAVHQACDATNECLLPTRERLAKINGAILHIENRMSYVTQRSVNLQALIDSEIGDLQQLLEHRKTALQAQVRDICKEKTHTLSGQKKYLETMRRQASDYLHFVEESLRKGSHDTILSVSKIVQGKPNGDVEESISSPLELSPLETANTFFAIDKTTSRALCFVGHVVSSSICVAACYAEGIGLSRATVYDEASFTVTLLGSDGNPCNDRLSHISVELIADANTDLVVAGKLVTQCGNEIEASYVPFYYGDCKLHIKIAGEVIKDSPFSVRVLPTCQFRGNFVRCISIGLIRPWGLAIAKNGDLVVIDNEGLKGVHIFTPDGELRMEPFCDTVHVWNNHSPDGTCYWPRGVALDDDDNIFVVDGDDNRIVCFDADRKYRATVGELGNKLMEFNKPIGIAIHRTQNDLYICDRGNSRIQVLQPNMQNGTFSSVTGFGRFWSETAKLLRRPWDIAFDSRDNAYIVDCDNYCLRVVSPDGELLQSIGRRGEGRGEFLHISSVCVDRSDFIYTTDWVRCLVTVFNPLGEFVMEFGSKGEKKGSGERQFYEPKGIAVDGKGYVYISTGNCVKVFE